MQYRTLPGSDLEVSVICQGCWSIIGGSTWGHQDRDDSVRALRAGLEAGVNFFDTAPGYGGGESEQLLARALGDRRKEVIIATKVSREDLAPDDIIKSCERSLRLLDREMIDLLQIHWPRPDIPVADMLEAMSKLRAAGKIRYIGVSNFGTSYLADIPDNAGVITNQLAYSLLWRPIEQEVIPACEARNLSVLAYSPMAQGLLAGKWRRPGDVPEGRARTRLFAAARPQSRHGERGCEDETFDALARIEGICRDLALPMAGVALAWVIAQNPVVSAIAGARNAQQAEANARAGELRLTGDVVEALREATETVKECTGANADMWQADSRMEKSP